MLEDGRDAFDEWGCVYGGGAFHFRSLSGADDGHGVVGLGLIARAGGAD